MKIKFRCIFLNQISKKYSRKFCRNSIYKKKIYWNFIFTEIFVDFYKNLISMKFSMQSKKCKFFMKIKFRRNFYEDTILKNFQ